MVVKANSLTWWNSYTKIAISKLCYWTFNQNSIFSNKIVLCHKSKQRCPNSSQIIIYNKLWKKTQLLKWHNFSINRNFSNTTTSQIPQLFKYHQFSNTTAIEIPPNLKYHNYLNTTKSQIPQLFKYHQISNITKSQIPQLLKYHQYTKMIKSQVQPITQIPQTHRYHDVTKVNNSCNAKSSVCIFTTVAHWPTVQWVNINVGNSGIHIQHTELLH